jgi:small-conductance mechanosensitive channel
VSNLAFEVLLRLAKALAALVVGLILWILLVGPFGVAPSPELALLCWLSGAAFILLVESSPI